ncbi:response regulator transcription factor [Isachenkonia alkalipeptolytica]|uniref:Transcriptional regulatory protein n=1 Tax=Isachenkonia alkalipeptolytica TaxID=2565777 RepID=A0AA43XHM9_9CLOT|nr:response regulator [Isachenkonia alkalipeptolytica]NBG87063.1 response regulator [Isachenkonia alkalipeptolytica]
MYRIAIVEDDPMVAKIHEQFLSSFEDLQLVEILSKGREAKDWLLKNDVDLIILDLFIPEMKGLDVLLALRQSKKEVDVIVVSAAKEKATIEEARHLGVYDYLIKPFSFNRLAVSLEAYMDRKKQLEKEEILTQKQLDQMFCFNTGIPAHKDPTKNNEGSFTNTGSKEKASLPKAILKVEDTKGIQKETLHYIAEYLMLLKEGKSAGELAEHLELGRVTIRRYLEFLYEQGLVSMSIEYGSVGRPKYLYRWKNLEQYEQNKL